MGLGKRNNKKLRVNLTPNTVQEIFLGVIQKSCCEASHNHSHSHSQSHSHLILDPGSAYPGHARGGEAPSSVIVVCRSRIRWLWLWLWVGVVLWLWLWLASQKDFLITSKKIS